VSQAFDQSTSGAFSAAGSRPIRWKLLIVNGVLLGCLAICAWFTRVYYYNFLYGPVLADDELLQAASREPGNGNLLAFVELRNRKLTDTGISEVTTRDNRPHSSYPYFTMPVGDQVLLVMAESGATGERLVGPMYRVGKFESEAIERIETKRPEMKGRFLPVMVNATAAFHVAGYLGLILAIPLALLFLANMVRAVLWP
jgi:hypothetical protein